MPTTAPVCVIPRDDGGCGCIHLDLRTLGWYDPPICSYNIYIDTTLALLALYIHYPSIVSSIYALP